MRKVMVEIDDPTTVQIKLSKKQTMLNTYMQTGFFHMTPEEDSSYELTSSSTLKSNMRD